MRKILLVSHGLMAMGMFEAYKMIVGQNENIRYICLSDGKDIEEFKMELNMLSHWMNADDELIVLSDIMGGSPYMTTIQYLQDHSLMEQTKMISGMNLPLVLTIGLSSHFDDEVLLNVINDAKNGIQLFEYCDDESDDEL